MSLLGRQAIPIIKVRATLLPETEPEPELETEPELVQKPVLLPELVRAWTIGKTKAGTKAAVRPTTGLNLSGNQCQGQGKSNIQSQRQSKSLTESRSRRQI